MELVSWEILFGPFPSKLIQRLSGEMGALVVPSSYTDTFVGNDSATGCLLLYLTAVCQIY